MNQSQIEPAAGRPKMAHAIRTMPRWKWLLLCAALVIGCVGLAGQGASMFLRPSANSAPAVEHSTNGARRGGSSGFVSGSPSADSTSSDGAPAPAVSPTMTDRLTPFMTRFGFSLFVGVVVGLVLRTFVRITALLVLVIALAMGVLAHFNINIDLSQFKAETSQASGWMMEQLYRLKDVVFHALPSSTAAGVGFFLGFKKR